MSYLPTKEILIVGAGISGCVIAERYASLGKKVLLIEKRDHIGGNCYDHHTPEGILVSKYGAHIFHTNNDAVWEYVQQFSEWIPYSHKVKARVDGKLVPIPVNIETVNTLFGTTIESEKQMLEWLAQHQARIKNPRNSEEVALNRVGKVLYEKMFKDYTIKQWDKHPRELDPLIMSRIPVRTNFEERYFTDKYQFQPKNGFTQLFENMLSNSNIHVQLNIDFLHFRKKHDISSFEKVFYTGPIDAFFDHSFKKEGLEYRSVKFEFETHNTEFYQENSVINYPGKEPFTRIVEYKYITGQKHSKTVTSKEFPISSGDPYYPVLTQKNTQVLKKYQNEAAKLKNVYFLGRLAEFRYLNMDDAFANALQLFSSLEKTT